MKICAGASAGGHMNQLLRLLKHTGEWPEQPVFYVTTLEEMAQKLAEKGFVYVIGEYNRYHPLRALTSLIRCIWIAIQERPDVVITTGSMPLAMFCFASKLLGARIVWIDSIANMERFSMSGRFVYLFADLFLTQWPELAKNDKKAEYVGAIL
jgi:UDP-N-acetylglucosamine:LPS N-acetylglucosamine transferase